MDGLTTAHGQRTPLVFGDGNKGIHWCFTVFNYNDDTFRKFEDIKEFTVYWVYGKEVCPSTGRLHLQCYLAGKKQITLPTIRKWFGADAKYFVCKGSPEQNRNYCIYDGDFTEWGVLPPDGRKKGGASTQAKWKSIADLAVNRDMKTIMDTYPREAVTSYRNLKQIGYDFGVVPDDLTKPCGEWIYGKSGVGKSFTARKENPGAYLKMMNKWWDNYENEDVVILEDFDPAYVQSMSYFLKIWADAYAFRVEIKNHTVSIRPKKFVVTSQYSLEQLFRDPEMLEAIKRRFTVRHLIELTSQPKDVKPTRKSTSTKVKRHDAIANSMKKRRLYLVDPLGRAVPNLRPKLQRELNTVSTLVRTNAISTQVPSKEEVIEIDIDPEPEVCSQKHLPSIDDDNEEDESPSGSINSYSGSDISCSDDLDDMSGSDDLLDM